jgi:hypothetical protein
LGISGIGLATWGAGLAVSQLLRGNEFMRFVGTGLTTVLTALLVACLVWSRQDERLALWGKLRRRRLRAIMGAA